MKKTLMRIAMLVLSLVLVFTMTACSEAPAPSTDGDAVDIETVVKGNLVMGTGGVSGSWYPMGGGFCTAMSDGNLNITVQASGGGVENVRTLLNGERDFGLAGADIAYYGYSGTSVFEGEDGSKLRSVMRFAPNQAHMIVRADSDVTCLADLKGLAVGCGASGSGDEVAMRMYLDTVGLSYDDIDEYLISVAEQSTAFKDRKIDVMYLGAAAPNSGVLDAASQADVKFVPLTGTEADNIIAAAPFFAKVTIPKETYSFMTEDLETLQFDTIMLTTEDVSAEQVYKALENMYNNMVAVTGAHPSLADLTMEECCNAEFAVPLHEGALKFYQDYGLM